jgi:hypothetical protein
MADDTLAPQPVADIPADPFAWTEDRKKLWKGLIDKALEIQEQYHPWWEQALKNYQPSVKENPREYSLEVRTNRSFAIVERKKADMFYQRPDVQVSPSKLLEAIPNNAPMASAHATIINDKLGRHGVNAKSLARDCVFAYELFGAGWSKIFYRAHTKVVEQPVRDQMGQPVTDPVTMAPVTESVPVVIKAEFGWEPISNKQVLIPADFRSTDFDKAPWLGMRFTMSTREARLIWGDKIPEGFKGSTGGSGKPQFFASGAQPDTLGELAADLVTGTELHYRSMLFRDDIVHPDHLTKLVMIDGIDEPVEERDSPDQTLDPQGRLTPDSLIGYPYHALVIRTLTDSAYIMSDVAVALPLTQELDKYRSQGVRQRDINLLKFVYDTSKLSPDDVQKLVGSEQGGLIGLPAEAFADPNGPIRPLQNAPVPPDNYAMSAALDHDLSQAFAIDAVASGTTATGSQTATESNLRQANVNVRQGSEQGFVADWYVSGVEKLSALIQKYLSVEDAAEIVGPQSAQAWDSWRKTIPARLAFTMTPDSSLRNDTPLERLQIQNLFTYLANDPTVNRRYFLEKVLQKFHIDSSRALLTAEQMPKPKQEEPKVSLSFKGEDLSPLSPQSPIVLDILMKSGMQIDPVALVRAQDLGQQAAARQVVEAAASAVGEEKPGQPEHGGKVAQLESLDKHATDITGGMQNSGEMMPGMGGGQPGGAQ